MRDVRFVAEHRGGPLKKELHRQLMEWAIACAEHVLPLYPRELDGRLKHALDVAKEWARGEVSTGKAMRASLGAHAAARESEFPVAAAVSRSIGQAVATAHMADHSLGAAWYALKAVKAHGGSVEAEREWQDGQLPADVRELVRSARERRNI
jgi:hypothetical protein